LTKKPTMNDIEKDFDNLIKKYNLTSCSMCATTSDNTFLGLQGPHKNIHEFIEKVTNVGRHWQHMREQTRIMLNRFERPMSKEGW
jgi:hypothetical protein